MSRLPGTRGGCARSGVSRVEVVVAVVVIVIVLAIVIPTPPPRRDARRIKDATQIKQIHAALVVYPGDFGGRYPLPSLLALQGQDDPEAASEDYTLNHSANIYSMLVMQDYLTAPILVSPLETADHVRLFEADGAAYDPAEGVVWDEAFVMHIHDPAVGANASYAHMAAVGDRRKLHWRDTGDPAVPVIGTRAPARPGGSAPATRRPWVGNICFADNHLELIENFFPVLSDYEPIDAASRSVPDNIYAADGEHPMGPQAAADAFLAIYVGATEFTVEDVYDPLETD
ncbi:MAG: hypothetical protein ACYS15_03085 [Planctomycetota bacterium]|jgi:hypothetical protein